MQNLKKLRLERKLSQQKLAEQFGITQQAIFNYENGITEPDIYMLKRMADFFHTSIDYLVGYTDCAVTYKDTTFLVEGNIPSNELRFLSMYRSMTDRAKGYVEGIVEEISDKKK